MPYEDEDPPHWQVSAELNELSKRVIGAALEVHKRLGAGLDEESYQKALEIEFSLQQVDFQRQVWIDVEYKGQIVGKRRLDFLIGGPACCRGKGRRSIDPIIQGPSLHLSQIDQPRIGPSD